VRRVYYVTYAFAGRMGSCEVAVDRPIDHLDQVREIEKEIKSGNEISGFLLVTNFILLRTEEV